MKDTRNLWLDLGYKIFATEGDKGLKIEAMAKQLGISKSSFYHHFVDLSIFKDYLLEHHLEQYKIVAEKENSVDSINPGLIDVIVEHKIDFLFNRQLRINQHLELHKDILDEASREVGQEFIKIWVKELDLKLSYEQLEGLFELALENFFLRINYDNLNHDWLSAYFERFKSIVLLFSR